MTRTQRTSTQPTRLSRDLTGAAPFTALQTAMNRLFDDVWGGYVMPSAALDQAMAVPEVDVSEDDSAVTVTADLPGLSAEDIDVEYTDGVLRIAGEKMAEQDQGAGTRQHVRERYFGRFERRIPVDRAIDRDGIDASFRNGVLSVKLPKSGEPDGHRKVTVRSAG